MAEFHRLIGAVRFFKPLLAEFDLQIKLRSSGEDYFTVDFYRVGERESRFTISGDKLVALRNSFHKELYRLLKMIFVESGVLP